MVTSDSLLAKMLRRGDKVSIDNGRLVVELASGKPLSDKDHFTYSDIITADILKTMGVSAFRYVGYSTGYYSGKYPGVTLQFIELLTGRCVFAIFNAILNYQRDCKHGKKGDPLPLGVFNIKPKSDFKQFWSRTGLATPPRYYDRMGNLSGLLFTADDRSGEKLNNNSIKPLTISVQQVNMTANSQLSHDQATTNSRLSATTKETAQSHTQQGLQPDSGAVVFTTIKGNKVTRVKGNVIPLHNTVINQSDDEWLADYDR